MGRVGVTVFELRGRVCQFTLCIGKDQSIKYKKSQLL